MCNKLEQYDEPEMRAHKFVRVINKVLLLHNAPILSFSLTFFPMSNVRIIHDYVDQWIPLLSRKGMKQLTLEDYEEEKFTAIHYFSSLEMSHLRLANAYLPCTPAFEGFTYLRKLELIDVSDLGNGILNCPVLEMLTLEIMAESSMRMRTRKTTVCRIKKDIISELPREVKEIILCLLPIQDAVRTSILSTKWRRCWTLMPNLIFDSQIFGSFKFSLPKIVSVINEALLLHSGPILKFSLTVPQDYHNAHAIHEHICQWILLLSEKGIQQFTLENSSFGQIPPDLSSLDLTHSRLTKVQGSSTPAFGGFTYLTNLELVNVAYMGQTIFNCPVLEKLKLEFCKGLSPTNFHSPNLRCLHEISDQITLRGVENLTEYSFGLYSYSNVQGKASNLVEVLGSLHTIEKFSVGILFIKYLAKGDCPNRLAKSMPYLKSLNIFHMDFTLLSEISCLRSLIRSAPNLCKLHISAVYWNKYSDEGYLEDFWAEYSEDFEINQLEIVRFSHFKGLRAELELVRFILARSPLLKTMFIHYSEGLDNNVAGTIRKEMMQYSKVSSRAQIRHSEEKPVNFSDCWHLS
ncbi:FBD domain-containing protein [Heracleum sosnowskyi]|uniref:FBD domain-containing protein n=1 Tax=Heracleum sosnowskyi TaxID=360622 RepID=A0AAD8LYV4_9APIA|nr:FBD domain-containing protein [Heracleum sosnowskyi]